MKHKISWLNMPGYTGETWNPIIGCSKVSEGCKNCYAERMSGRLANMQSQVDSYGNIVEWDFDAKPDDVKPMPKFNGETYLVKSQFNKPPHWKRPRMVFVCSMGDLFHKSIPYTWIDKVFDVITENPQHLFIILTKRPKNALNFFRHVGLNIKNAGLDSVPSQSNNLLDYVDAIPNLWLGVTAENQKTADRRIPTLLQIPAAVKFVSVEPMLGPVDIKTWLYPPADGYIEEMERYHEYLDWVICGGESGPGARPMHQAWMRDLKKQCNDAGTPFFFKQWGPNKAGNLIDGKQHMEWPTIRNS